MSIIGSRFAPITVCLAFGLAACGDDSSKTDETATTVADTTAPTNTSAPETSATDAPDTSVPDSTETSATDTSLPDEVFDSFVITLSSDGWLVDGTGRSIYTFNNDTPFSLVSTCTADCASTWPPVTVDNVEELEFDEGFAAEDFDFIFRDEGGIQLTYFGAPLYYFAGDTAPGDQNGEGVGGVWYLAFYGLGG